MRKKYKCTNAQCKHKWHYVGVSCKSPARKMVQKSGAVATYVGKKTVKKSSGVARRYRRRYPILFATGGAVLTVALVPAATPWVGLGLALYIMTKKFF